MATVALFHSVLGLRPGFVSAAELLRSYGHRVRIVDQYDGRVFDDYDEALEFMRALGFPALLEAARKQTDDLPDGLVTAGFSNGAGMAEYVGCTRPGIAGILLLSGALDPKDLDATWPRGVDGQTHNTLDDPWREQEGIDAVVEAANKAGGRVEVFDYPGSGHLFADASKTDEFQPAEAELMWSRVLEFLRRIDNP